MSQDALERLLRQADEAAGPGSTVLGDLADRARQRARRQRSLRLTSGAVAAALVLMVGVYSLQSGSLPQATPTPVPVVVEDTDYTQELAELRADIARLKAEMNEALAQVRALTEAKTSTDLVARQSRVKYQPSPADRLKEEFEKTAFLIVYRGDRLYRTHGLIEPAIESYRRAIELFPESRWADIARERLTEIEQPKGDRL